MKTVVQCDFDGTITEKDVSFFLLDTFAEGDWRQLLNKYMLGRMAVGTFNRKAFAMVKADRQTLTEYVLKSGRLVIRPGFKELLGFCSREGLEFVIVSNGLLFYIEAILENIGVDGVKVFAAQSQFSPKGMQVKYVGPNGSILEAGFKEAYTEMLKRQGYSVVYVGNGVSDIYPARQSRHVFATGDLLKLCQEEGLECTPFTDLTDVVKGMKTL
jgi:2-hydroxy-3-keto-5-methylthiopentenyl-1-phosphate phosphatase